MTNISLSCTYCNNFINTFSVYYVTWLPARMYSDCCNSFCWTPIPGNCFLSVVKAGTLTSAQEKAALSLILKPHWTSIASPISRFLRIAEVSVIYLLLTSSPHPFEISRITPFGLLSIRNLTVLWWFCWYHIADLVPRLEGFLTKLLMQSIMTATLVLKHFQNDIGIVAIIFSRSAHTIKYFIQQ